MVRKFISVVLCICLISLQTMSYGPALAEELGNCDGSGRANCDQTVEDIEASLSISGSGMSPAELEAERRRLQDLAEQDSQSGFVVDMGSGTGSGSGGGLSAAYTTPEFHTLMVAIAIAVQGVPFGFTCATQPSGATFGTVALIFLIAELVQTAQTKKASERRLSIITSVSQDMLKVQTDALEMAIEQTQDAANRAGTRADITNVVAVFFVICAILAFSEGFLFPADACPVVAWWDQILERAMFISKAQAGDGLYAPLGIEGSLEGAFTEVLVIVKLALVGAALRGMARGVVMSVFADICFDAVAIIRDRKARLEKRIAIYKELLKKLKLKTDLPAPNIKDTKIKSLGGGSADPSDSISIENQNLDLLKGDCVTGDPEKATLVADLGCKGKPMETIETSDIINNPVVELPTGIMDAPKNAKEFATNLSRGKGMSGGMHQYDGAAFAKYKDIKNETGKKLNDFLTKHHKDTAPGPFEEAEKEMRKKLMGDVALALNKYSPSELNSMMGQLMSTDSPDVKKVNAILEAKKINPAALAGSSGKIEMPKIKLDEEGKSNFAAKEEKELTSANALQNLEYNENDINKDGGASIFLILSNRYRKSAFRLLFEKEEPAKK